MQALLMAVVMAALVIAVIDLVRGWRWDSKMKRAAPEIDLPSDGPGVTIDPDYPWLTVGDHGPGWLSVDPRVASKRRP